MALLIGQWVCPHNDSSSELKDSSVMEEKRANRGDIMTKSRLSETKKLASIWFHTGIFALANQALSHGLESSH